MIALLEQITGWCRPDSVVILDDTDGDHARQFAHTVRRAYPGADVHVRSGADRIGGPGGAVFAGLTRAARAGHRFAVVLDADGQHPAAAIPPHRPARRTVTRGGPAQLGPHLAVGPPAAARV